LLKIAVSQLYQALKIDGIVLNVMLNRVTFISNSNSMLICGIFYPGDSTWKALEKDGMKISTLETSKKQETSGLEHKCFCYLKADSWIRLFPKGFLLPLFIDIGYLINVRRSG
jgi:hypothetical protein